MSRGLLSLALLTALLAAPASVFAQDMGAMMSDGAGLPIKPSDAAAGPWTLTTDHKPICTLSLSADRSATGVYGVDIPADCAPALPSSVAGWKPVADGLALVGADGAVLADFNQWTTRDLVAPRRGAPFLELTRPKA
jgi:hypothetical protein